MASSMIKQQEKNGGKFKLFQEKHFWGKMRSFWGLNFIEYKTRPQNAKFSQTAGTVPWRVEVL